MSTTGQAMASEGEPAFRSMALPPSQPTGEKM